MRASLIGLVVLGTLLAATSASAYDPYDPNNCNGIEWDDTQPLMIAKVTAKPRVNFIKSPYDDDFKADSCPTATAACRKQSYLVAGDLVLLGKTKDNFTCVSFQAPRAKKAAWSSGWLPSSALTPVAPTPAPDMTDWIGNWDHPLGSIEIRRGGIGGRLKIEGVMLVPAGKEIRNGVIEADVMPGKDGIAFLNDGWLPFETQCEDACRVRMRRVGPYLLVEDNGGCGGAGVSFTGLYHRK